MADYDRLARVYRKIRDARSDLKREYEERDGKLKEQLETIEHHLMALLNEDGASSVKTEFGTIYTSETAKVSVADWGALAEWIRENDALEFLEQRVRATEVNNYLEQHKELPPGVNLYRERNVRVRKS